MFDLVIRPRSFFEVRKDRLPELTIPAAIVVMISGLTYCIYLRIVGVLSETLSVGVGDLAWRLLAFSGVIGSISILFIWLILAAVMSGTAIVLWDKEIQVLKFLEVIGFSATPILIHQVIALAIFSVSTVDIGIWDPSQDTGALLRRSPELRLVSHSALAAYVWSATLLTFAINSISGVGLRKSIITVALPVALYQVVRFMVQIF